MLPAKIKATFRALESIYIQKAIVKFSSVNALAWLNGKYTVQVYHHPLWDWDSFINVIKSKNRSLFKTVAFLTYFFRKLT
jgi:hypothetical protein